MKKIVSVLLASAMVISLAACNANDNGSGKSGRDGETVGDSKPAWGSETSEYTELTETEATTTTTTVETTETTPAVTTSKYGVVTDYVSEIGESYGLESKAYHAPYVNIDSEYTQQMREEIDEIFEYYREQYEENGNCHYNATLYLANLSPDGILSIVLVEIGEWDDHVFHVWNIDCVTGLKVDNAKIAELAGIKDIRTAAMDAVQIYINNRGGGITCENHEAVNTADVYVPEVEATFSEERINDDMMMGVTGDGTVFFISDVVALGGAPSYYEIYDINGINLAWYSSDLSGMLWM
jgi:hypothetical protein